MARLYLPVRAASIDEQLKVLCAPFQHRAVSRELALPRLFGTGWHKVASKLMCKIVLQLCKVTVAALDARMCAWKRSQLAAGLNCVHSVRCWQVPAIALAFWAVHLHTEQTLLQGRSKRCCSCAGGCCGSGCFRWSFEHSVCCRVGALQGHVLQVVVATLEHVVFCSPLHN